MAKFVGTCKPYVANTSLETQISKESQMEWTCQITGRRLLIKCAWQPTVTLQGHVYMCTCNDTISSKKSLFIDKY